LPEAECRDCGVKVEAYAAVGKGAKTHWYEPFHEGPGWLV